MLVAYDDAEFARRCAFLASNGFVCIGERDPSKVLQEISILRPDVVIANVRIPHMLGLQILDSVSALHPEIVVILETAQSALVKVGEVMHEFPLSDESKNDSGEKWLLEVVRQGLSLRVPAAREPDSGQERRASACDAEASVEGTAAAAQRVVPAFHSIVGASPEMKRVFDRIQRAAQSDASVLLEGETGTGKELVARAIHALSRRANGPFVPVDELPEGILESELFGHERGSFTGAYSTTRGLVEEANGGTLFLDEISTMSPGLQARLLRVLHDGQVRHIGSTKLIKVDFRLISASNRNLSEIIARGHFREDLYYRLNVIRITLPPLRSRHGDVPFLANHFLRHYAQHHRKDVQVFSDEAIRFLDRYSWPGNVRELENVIESVVALADGRVIRAADLPEHVVTYLPKQEQSKSFKETKDSLIRSFEYTYLTQLVRKHRGHIGNAAQEAGVDRKTIERLLKKYNIREVVQEKATKVLRFPRSTS